MTGPSSAGGDGRRVCGATLKQPRDDGRSTCDRPRGWGTSHAGFGNCKFHGGSTPNGVAAAAKESTEQALANAQRTFGLPLDVEPGEALLGLVRTSAGVCAWLAGQVGALEGAKVTTVNQKTHPLVSLYLEERKHLAAVAKSALDAGIAERRVRLEEEQGRLIVGLLERVVGRLGEYVLERTGQRVLDPMDPQVRELVRVELAAIEAGEAA